MPAAIIYIRVSTDEQVQGTSLATQEADCRTWCARNGHALVELFRDEGESAKTANRPGLLAALGRVRAGGIDAFVAWKLDRVARNATDGLAIRSDLRRRNCRLVSATEAISDDPVGEMVGTVLLAVAQFDNQVRAARCRRGMQATAMAGGWCSRPPIGFLLDRSGNIPVLKPDPATAPVIIDAFTGLASGRLQLSGAVRLMRSLRMPKQTVSKAFRSPVYGGIIRSALTDDLEVKAAFPGLVTPDVWRQVQRALRVESPHAKAGKNDFSLSLIAVCEACGGPICGSYSRSRQGKIYGYYCCRRGHIRVRSDQAHADLNALFANQCAPAVAGLRESVACEAVATIEDRKAAREAAEKRRGVAEARLARLADGYADGVIDGPTYTSRAATYRAEITSARIDAKSQQAGIDTLLSGLDRIVELMSNPAELWKRLELKGRKQLADVLGLKLVISADGRCRTATSANASAGLLHETGAKYKMVGDRGLEPPTPCMSSKCSNQLS